MDQAHSVADLSQRAVIAANLNRDLKVIAGVLAGIGAADLARMAHALDIVELMALPPDKAAALLEQITGSLQGLHGALAKYAAFETVDRPDHSKPS